MEKEIVNEKGVDIAQEIGTIISSADPLKSVETGDRDVLSVENDGEMERLYEDSMKSFKEGENIKGHVVDINQNTVTVDIGFKSEGVISRNEFPNYAKNLNVGDEIIVFLERVEDKNGQVVLSKEKADKIKIWDDITRSYNNNEPVEGVVTERIKGGLNVDIVGLKAFLPGSQIDLKPIKNLDKLIGQKFRMKIIKMNKKKGNIVLSRRILLEEERKTTRNTMLSTLEVGKIIEGTVKNITEYGAFVDLGGIDGLLHITDMSWGRVSHPSELFAIGDTIKVMVLKYDKDNQKVSLGYKQITPDPWAGVGEKYAVGTRIRGKVVSVTDYGAFIELEDGVEGLIHVSEMSWSKYLKHPSKIVAIGDTVEAIVLSIDREKKKISLSMKQTEPNPWLNIEEKYPVGAVVEGRVRNLTDFGAFVELEEDIDGLIHISDMSWTQKIKYPSELLKKRDKVKAVVLNVDKENERLALGIKQLTPDPWKSALEKYMVGMDVKGKIVKTTKFGAFAELEDGLEGLIHISQLSSKKVNDPKEVVSVGDEVDARVIKIDPSNRRIGLSIKAYSEGMDNFEGIDIPESEFEEEITEVEITNKKDKNRDSNKKL
jgi:small subunit ribosomal protein S1